MQRSLVVALGLVVGTAACTEEVTSPVEPDAATVQASYQDAPHPVYRIAIHNLTEGQPLTPPLAALHGRRMKLFRVGRPAPLGIQEIAENGNLAPMIEALTERLQPSDVLITPGPETVPGPIMAGETVEFDVVGTPGAHYFSWASMLICTNDGFTGVNRRPLPRRVGGQIHFYTRAWDAGTEVNTEAWPDLVPPCGPLTGFDSMGQGTGMSNPELAEGGVVRPHRGIAGDADLVREVHGWHGPIARVVIERIG